MYYQRRPTISLVVLSICLLFLGINGLIGGALMLSDPYGAPMGMSVTVLERTPFQNFIVPGFCLILIWGVGSLVTLIGLWRRPHWLDWANDMLHEHWAWSLSVLLGLALVVWLTFQLFTLPEVAPIQYILYGLALFLVLTPLLPEMRRYYRISDRRVS